MDKKEQNFKKGDNPCLQGPKNRLDSFYVYLSDLNTRNYEISILLIAQYDLTDTSSQLETISARGLELKARKMFLFKTSLKKPCLNKFRNYDLNEKTGHQILCMTQGPSEYE